ncbi:MAG: sigma factor-like helix-turn-helix DNA-binding protein [Gemmatimonadota bacterium]|nr:sigma factor-like helix-turn-helix DNA-binding protein [Gemmatimonadota bacterium]
MPEPVQSVFILNRYNGYKYREIAEILGVSVKTVEGRMTQALRHSREKLAPFLVGYMFFLL